ETDGEHIVAAIEIGVGLDVLDVGSEAPDTGKDRLAIFRMLSDLARQRQQAERALKIDIVGCETLRDAGALRLLAVDCFAELDVGAEAARTQGHFEAGRQILAELLHAAVGRAVTVRELAGVATLRIIGAADEAAELAELERKPAALTLRAFAGIDSVRA